MTRFVVILALAIVASCSRDTGDANAERDLPVTRWDHVPNGAAWTAATVAALHAHGTPLLTMLPTDADEYCPGFELGDDAQRSSFWVGLFSALAFYESTWKEDAVGGGGRWYGLVQIDPRSADWYGCEVTSRAGLLNGEANMRCAVRIAAKQVPRAGSIAVGMRDWGPFHNELIRAKIAAWTREQPYCAAPGRLERLSHAVKQLLKRDG